MKVNQQLFVILSDLIKNKCLKEIKTQFSFPYGNVKDGSG